jgi:uncharacterized protein (DUF3820 family)
MEDFSETIMPAGKFRGKIMADVPSSYENPMLCGNCGSKDLVTGETGTLDKEVLKKEWRDKCQQKNI